MFMNSLKDEITTEVCAQLAQQGGIEEDELYQLIEQRINERAQFNYIRLGDRIKLRHDIYNAIRGMDVLEDLLEDEDISEIMINGPANIFIERKGLVEKTKLEFSSSEKLMDIARQIASRGNRLVNESSPIVDCRLSDGSRVNCVLPPVALDGPVVTIRRFPKESITMEKLIDLGSITQEAADFLKQLVYAKYNIFISGGTGAGKTTFLNALSNFIPQTERIITIEDSAELQIKQVPNIVRMEARNDNVEGSGAIRIRDMIKCALRMRPDRVIVGEIRDEAAIDMLSAFNTGHDGSISTGHANSTQDMLNRMETLVLMGLDIPLEAIRAQISSAIDIVIHLGRQRDGSRKVVEISEVGEVANGQIEIHKIFDYIPGQGLIRTKHQIINQHKLQSSKEVANAN